MGGLDDLVGRSPGIAAVLAQVHRLVARPNVGGRLPPILVLGETGTGKGLLVRIMHQISARRKMPLVEINCAAIPEHLVEAELFGFERGAFTDARQSKPGLFQSAHRGVLFLDEIGSLPLPAQAKLLTALEQHEVRRLGSTRAEPVDAWIVSATNEDLAAAVAQGKVRVDLYHRISTVTLHLPPLRERGRDVLVLARHFLDRLSTDYGLPPRRLTATAEEALLTHSWPGNVRELANLMERAVLFADTDEISPDLLELPSPPDRRSETTGAGSSQGVGAEREVLQAALDATEWNLSRAAGRLGIPRNTLRYRIERLGLHPRHSRTAERNADAPAAGAATGVPPSPLRWERRRITGLLVALESPPSVSAFHLTPLLDDLARKVESFGGRLEDLHPLGFTALFGQEPVEDAPARAALAIQAVRKAIEGARDLGGGRVVLTAALHTAESLIARGTATGGMDLEDRTRLRHALTSLAGAFRGRVVLSADATPFLERRFVLERLTDHPQPAYRLVGPRRTDFDVGDRARSPFVGRDRELSQLDDLLSEVERGRGQIVGVVGEPGVGKSRLLYEFSEGVGRERAAYLEGRCASHGSHTPYLPIIHLLHQAFGATEVDDPATIAGKARRTVDGLGLPGESMVPYLLQLLGVRASADHVAAHLTPEAVRDRTLDALRQVMIAASQQRPMIIAIEDLQWIDATSAHSLMALADSIAASRILMLATYRQGYQPAWLGKSYATQLVVRRLSPGDSARIVEAMTGPAVSREIAEALIAKAEGIPFFLEELVRALADRPAGAAPAAIPGTIQEAITARVDRLHAADRAVLEAACVLGKEGPVALLRAVSGLPDPDFSSALARLQLTEFLRETRVVPFAEYAFTHVLTQEVAYRNLAADRRRALHTAAADATQQLVPHTVERRPELLAHHLTEAGLVGPAIQHWHRAGRLAIQRSANAEAVVHLTKALTLLEARTDDADRATLEVAVQLSLVTALIAIRGYAATEVGQHLARARSLVERLGESPQTFFVRWNLWRFYISRADFRVAEELAAELLRAGEVQADATATLNAHVATGVNKFYLGEFGLARDHLNRALHLYRQGRNPQQVPMYGQDMGTAAQGFLGWTLAVTGDLDAAAQEATRAVALAKEIAHPFSLALVLLAAGEVYQLRREPGLVDSVGRELLDLARDHAFTLFHAFGLMFSGWARATRGDLPDGLSMMQQGANLFRSLGQRIGLAHRAHLAEILIAHGSLDASLAVLGDALRQSEDTGEGAFMAELHRLRGEALRQRARSEDAEASLRSALAVATRQGAWLFALRAASDLVQLSAERGSPVTEDFAVLNEIVTRFSPSVESSDVATARSLLGEHR